MEKPPEPSTKKRKKLPSLGVKLNRSFTPDEEEREIHSFLLQQKELLQDQKIEKNHSLITAEWDDSIFQAKVTKNSGSSLELFGHNEGGSVFLHPEETLYLIEMNKLQLFYNNIRLSVQRSYNVLLQPTSNITIHQYMVFKHFVIQGYKLFRHESLPTDSSCLEEAKPCPKSPYGEYLKNLQLFDSVKKEDFERTNVLTISYDVFIPNSTIKKTCRPKPNYYLIILESEENIWNLMYLVKHCGKTNLLFASVDGSTVSVFSLQDVQIPILSN